MTFYRALNAGILFAALTIVPVQAQVETVAKSKFSCTYEKQVGKGVVGSLATSVKLGVISEVNDSRRKKYAIKAAKQALEAGYNYALMEPLRIIDRRRRQQLVNQYGGRALGFTEGAQFKSLHCEAYDDIAAYNFIINKNSAKNAADGEALVDLRELIAAFDDGKPYSGKRKPQIAVEHIKGVGTRERIAKQHPIMMAALQCSPRLRPTSLKNFTSTPSAGQLAQEKQCLNALRPQAKAIGWNDFALFLNDAPTSVGSSGYVRNRPTPPKTVTGTTVNYAPEAIWGAGWEDMSSDFGGFSGVALKRKNRALYASNILTPDELYDYAVFTAASKYLLSSISGFTLIDKTAEGQTAYDSDYNYLIRNSDNLIHKDNKKYNAALKKRDEDISRTQERLLDVQENLQTNFKRIDTLIRQNEGTSADTARIINELSAGDFFKKRKQATLNTDLKTAEGFMKLGGATPAEIDEAKRGIRAKAELGTNPHMDSLLSTRGRQLADEQKYQTELSQLQQSITPIAPNAPTTVDRQLVSKDRRSRGEPSAFAEAKENYRYVLSVEMGGANGGRSKCAAKYEVCGDKIQAYNALGPKLNVQGFFEVSQPPKYEAYVPAPN